MLRNRGTVDFDHWEAFSLAVLMNNSGNNFLANTGFAIDHDVGGIAGNFKRLAQSGLGLQAMEDISARTVLVRFTLCVRCFVRVRDRDSLRHTAYPALDVCLHLREPAH